MCNLRCQKILHQCRYVHCLIKVYLGTRAACGNRVMLVLRGGVRRDGRLQGVGDRMKLSPRHSKLVGLALANTSKQINRKPHSTACARARPLATRAGLAGGRKVYQLRPFAHMPGVEIVFPSSFPITQHSQASPRSSNRMETDREGTLMKLPNP